MEQVLVFDYTLGEVRLVPGDSPELVPVVIEATPQTEDR